MPGGRRLGIGGGGGRGKERRRGYDKLGASELDEKELLKKLSIKDIVIILSPFFWPNNVWARLRSMATWVCVALSKICSLMAPLFLSNATNAVVSGKYQTACVNVAIYCTLRFSSNSFKEAQGLIFLKVKQQAYVELAQKTFEHIHKLSLNWHLTKKTGNIIRSMDRGTEAASLLVSMIFLYLGPSILEAVAVVIIFFTHFGSWPLGLLVLCSVSTFIASTVFIAMWRKKLREETNKSDNDFHEKATDSIINFETVKYFTAEKFELDQFCKAVREYQTGVVSTQIAQSIMSVFQDGVVNITVFGSLVITGKQVRWPTFLLPYEEIFPMTDYILPSSFTQST